MKKLLFPILIVLMYSGLAFGQTNLVKNGDFEQWENDKQPSDWNKYEAVSKETTQVKAGSFSAKMYDAADKKKKKLFQDISGIVAGESYTISFWYYDNSTANCRMWSYWYSGTTKLPDHEAELHNNAPGWELPGGAEWKKYEVTLTAPAGADRFRFEVRGYTGPGKQPVYFDEFSMVNNSGSTNETSITNITLTPAAPTTNDDATIAATITDADGIQSATLLWGTTSGSLDQSVAMSNSSGDAYSGIIAKQAAGTQIFYAIKVIDNNNNEKESEEKSYTVMDVNATSITNITLTPAAPTTNDDATVSATITDADGIQSATLLWGTTSGSLDQTVAMTASGSVYSGIIAKQAAGTQIFYAIKVIDNNSNEKVSEEKTYTVKDANATGTTLSYEGFKTTKLPAGWLTVTPTYATNNFKWRVKEFGGNAFLRASSYKKPKSYATEQWVVTPAFSTQGNSNVKLVFDNQKNYKPFQDLEVYVSTDFAGDSASFTTASWTKLTVTGLADKDGWGWKKAEADLNAYLNQDKVYIAFKYLSTNAAGGVWDIDNVKIVKDGVDPNPGTGGSGSVVEVANIGELRSKDFSDRITVYKLTGKVFLTFQQAHRNQKYVEDNTGAIILDDQPGKITTTYNLYDGITGITGTLTEAFGTKEFIPTQDPGAGEAGTFTPAVVTIEDLKNNFADYESELVTIKGVSFAEAGQTFAVKKSYNLSKGSASIVFRTNFEKVDYINGTIPSGPQDVTGVVAQFKGKPQIISRNFADIVPAGTTGLCGMEEQNISLYPNPVQQTLIVNGTEEIAKIQIVNLSGQTVKEIYNHSESIQIDMKEMPNGVYLFVFTGKNGKTFTKNIVKQ